MKLVVAGRCLHGAHVYSEAAYTSLARPRALFLWNSRWLAPDSSLPFSQLTFSPSFSSCHSAFSFHALLSLACNFPQRYLMVFWWIWILFLSGWNADVQPVGLFHTPCANIPEWAIIFKTKSTIANVSSVPFKILYQWHHLISTVIFFPTFFQ